MLLVLGAQESFKIGLPEPLSFATVVVDRVAPPRYTSFMRGVVPRLVLLLLLLLGAAVIIGFQLEDEDSPVALLRQSQPLQTPRADAATRTAYRFGEPASTRRVPRKDSTFNSRSASLITLACVLRC